MKVSLISDNIYRFTIGRNIYNIKADSVIQAKDDLLKYISNEITASALFILTDEAV